MSCGRRSTADLSGVRGVELIVVAVPVDAAVDVLPLVAPHAGAARLITDVGSTKARIVDAAISANARPTDSSARTRWPAITAPAGRRRAPVYFGERVSTSAPPVRRQ